MRDRAQVTVLMLDPAMTEHVCAFLDSKVKTANVSVVATAVGTEGAVMRTAPAFAPNTSTRKPWVLLPNAKTRIAAMPEPVETTQQNTIQQLIVGLCSAKMTAPAMASVGRTAAPVILVGLEKIALCFRVNIFVGHMGLATTAHVYAIQDLKARHVHGRSKS